MARVKRNRSYQSAWGRTQPQDEYAQIHRRWADSLAAQLPEGVPPEQTMRCKVCECTVKPDGRGGWQHGADDCWRSRGFEGHAIEVYLDERWPVTFGTKNEDGTYNHDGESGASYCLQCGGCQYYIMLRGDLGGDWGVCSNPQSQYDRTAVNEHWTCRHFKY